MTRSHPGCRFAAPIVAAAMLALAFGAVPASAFSTYGVTSGAWSKRFTFNGCEMRVRWGVESATGVARARFYTRHLARCSAAAREGAGPGWMGALAGESSGFAMEIPGRRSSGTHTDACGRYVEWKASAPTVTGLQLNLVHSGRLQNPFFRIESHGSTLPHATRC